MHVPKRRIKNVLLIDVPTYKVKLSEVHSAILRRKLLAQKLIWESRVGERLIRPGLAYSRGMLSLASCLELRGFSVRYINYSDPLDRQQFSSFSREADVVAVNALTPTMGIVKALCKSVRLLNPQVMIVLGGPHVTVRPAKSLEECSPADYAMIGDCETRLPALLESLDIPDSIAGTAYRDEDGSIRLSTKPILPVVEQELPLPAYHLLSRPLSSYAHNIRTTRGCPFQCNFCLERSSWTSPDFGERSPEQVLVEVEFLSKHVPQGTLVHFSDAIFNLRCDRTAELIDRLAEAKLQLLFSLDTRADLVEKHQVKALTRARFVQLRIGFENLNDGILRNVGKSITYEQQVEASESIRQISDCLVVYAYMVTGFPGTTRLQLLLDALKIQRLVLSNLVDIISNNILVPYPGTPYYDSASSMGITVTTHDWGKYDRRSLPVYQMANIGRRELFLGFLIQELVLAQAYVMKLAALGVDNEAWNEVNVASDYVYRNYVADDDDYEYPKPGDGGLP